jgi:hypothetical protein
MIDLFDVRDFKKCHEYFNILKDGIHFSAAKEFIEESIKTLGNNEIFFNNLFITDFQQTGFNQRIWELYLFFMLQEQGFNMLDLKTLKTTDNTEPDFFVNKNSKNIIIEATTLGDIQDKNAIADILKEPMILSNKIKRSLSKKLEKDYLKLGHPVIIAFSDFHFPSNIKNKNNIIPRSAEVSFMALREALYGKIENLTSGIVHSKLIDSSGSFFNTPDANNVDAILYSRSGTLPKFNRMGKMIDLGSDNVIIMSMRSCCNFDPKSSAPSIKASEINKNLEKAMRGDKQAYYERLVDGTEILYNPKIKQPIFCDLFPYSAHTILREDNIFQTTFPVNNNDYVFNYLDFVIELKSS